MLDELFSKYKIEAFLVAASVVIVLISGLLFIKAGRVEPQEEDPATNETVESRPAKIRVDLSGAVEKPDIYEVTAGARLKDILILAGGLSADADRQFFGRNFNLARALNDQDKIYIPSAREISAGIFTENPKVLDYTKIAPLSSVNLQNSNPKESNTNPQELININKATIYELDELPGVGKVTAQKIIDNRPYSSIEELVSKKIINKITFEKIKGSISVN